MRESLKRIKISEDGTKKGQSNLLNFIEKTENDTALNQKITNAEQFEIVCDNRETASSVVRNLSLMGINLKLEQLSVGDYVISKRVGIERKSSQDFTDSIKDGKETAMFLYQLAKKEQSDSNTTLKLRFDKAPIETSRLLEYLIAGIPGINTLRAKNLLKELKTLQNIFLADIPDLTKIENIGKKIAQEIYKISRYKYKNDH